MPGRVLRALRDAGGAGRARPPAEARARARRARAGQASRDHGDAAPQHGGGRPVSRKSAVSRVEKQERTREALLRAASRLFCRRGLEGTSVDEAAGAAGYTKGALYANFKSKEELFLVMLDEKFSRELERLDHDLAGTDDPDAEARTAAAGVIHFASDYEWPRLYFQFGAHAARNEEFRQELATRQEAMRDRLVKVYERWTRDYGIDPPLPIA